MKINKEAIPQYLLYLTIIAAFPGAYVMSVEIGSIHLFPYRYLLIILLLIFIAGIYANSWLLNVSQIKVRIYLFSAVFWAVVYITLASSVSTTIPPINKTISIN